MLTLVRTMESNNQASASPETASASPWTARTRTVLWSPDQNWTLCVSGNPRDLVPGINLETFLILTTSNARYFNIVYLA